MNKKIGLWAAIMMISPVLPVVGSADSCFQDMKTIIQDKSMGKTDQQRLENVQRVLNSLRVDRNSKENSIISVHTIMTDYRIPFILGMGCSAVEYFVGYAMGNIQNNLSLEVVAYPSVALITWWLSNKFNIYWCKKKLEEINEVISRLELMQALLLRKHYMQVNIHWDSSTRYSLIPNSQEKIYVNDYCNKLYGQLEALEILVMDNARFNNEVAATLKIIDTSLAETFGLHF